MSKKPSLSGGIATIIFILLISPFVSFIYAFFLCNYWNDFIVPRFGWASDVGVVDVWIFWEIITTVFTMLTALLMKDDTKAKKELEEGGWLGLVGWYLSQVFGYICGLAATYALLSIFAG